MKLKPEPAVLYAPLLFVLKKTGLPRHRENREFGAPFFQTGKTQGISQNILKICFYTGNLTPTQGKFKGEKKKKNSDLVI